LASAVFVVSTDPAELMRSLVQHARLKPFFAFSVFSAVQFLPYLAEDLRQIRLARRMRRRGKGGALASMRDLSGAVVPLLASTVRRAGRAAISMESRGLKREMRRSSLHASRFSHADAIFALAALLLPSLLALGAAAIKA
jgi:energy-coupling factor transport system permease protein